MADLNIGDKVEFSFFGEKKTGTITDFDGDKYIADFDKPISFKQFEDFHVTFIVRPTHFIKVKAPESYFKKIRQSHDT